MTSIKNGIGVGATAIIVCERLSSNIIGLLGGNFCKNVGYFKNAETTGTQENAGDFNRIDDSLRVCFEISKC
jgi:hypothetical protein